MKTKITYRQFLVSVLTFNVLLFFATLVNANGSDATKTFDVSGFDKLSLGSAFKITVTKGSFSVKVAGRQEDIDELEANVSGGKLKIKFKNQKMNNWNNNRKRVDVTISMPNLKGLDFSGATTSKVSGFDDLSTLDLEISGASSSEISVKADKINVNISGASTVNLSGSGQTLQGDISGATSFRAYDYAVKDVDLEVSGASTAKINASGSIKVEANGASSVRYKGTATIRSNTSGASSIKSDS